MFPWTILEQDQSLQKWITVEVHVHGVIATKELVSFQVDDYEQLSLRNDAL